MEEFTLQDYENVLCLRNQLINIPTSQLLEVYQDYENYITFLDTVSILSNIDSAFLLFDSSFVDKIRQVIQIHRFTSNDSQINEVVNGIIQYLNQIEAYDFSYTNCLKNAYLLFQEDTRKVCFDDEDVFLYSLSYDAIVYVALKENNMDLLTEDDMYLASINSFVEMIPDFFSDEKIHKLALHKITEIEKQKWPYPKKIREYSKETKMNFQKIKQKEE